MVMGSGGSPTGQTLRARCVGDLADNSGTDPEEAAGCVKDCAESWPPPKTAVLLMLAKKLLVLPPLAHQTEDCWT